MSDYEIETVSLEIVDTPDVVVTVDAKGKATVVPEIVEPDENGDIYIVLVSADPAVEWIYFAKDPINIDNPGNFTHNLDSETLLHVTDSSADKHEHPTHKYTLKVVKSRDESGEVYDVKFVNSEGVTIDPVIRDRPN